MPQHVTTTITNKERRNPSAVPGERDGAFGRYLTEIDLVGLIDREEEAELARRANAGDRTARDRLITAHLRFVVRVAKQYRSAPLPLADLVSEGNLGLMRALDGFDPERGTRFLTYAVWRIRQAIHKAICEKARSIRLPAHRINRLTMIRKAAGHLEQELGRKPSAAEIARWIHADADEVRELLEHARDTISLEAPLHGRDDAPVVAETVASPLQTPETHAIGAGLKRDINRALSTLTSRQADVVERRFGLNGKRQLSLKELAGKYSLSSERIRQIEREALDRLRLPSRQRLLQEYHREAAGV